MLLAVLLAGSLATALVLFRVRLPNCWMLGGAVFASLLTVFGLELSVMPREGLSMAQVLIGVALNLGVPLVTAYHIVRILMITVFTLPAFHLARRLLGDRATETA